MKTATFTERENTLIFNGCHGWTGETKVQVNGYNYVITTMKRSNGFVVSNSRKVQDEGEGSFSFMVFGVNNSKELLKEKVSRVTESVIKAAHFKALSLFLDSEELPNKKDAYQIEVGQVIFTSGYNKERESRRVIYGIEGNNFKTVSLDGKQTSTDSHIRSFADKFGIGVYYNEGDKINFEEVQDLVISAKMNEKKEQEVKNEKKLRLAEERIQNISAGAKVLDKLPENCKALIIGEFEENQSDSMSDYFGSHTTKKVFLGFSSHTKHVFSEMSKAALNFEDTKHLANNTEFENRENYSGGHGYYLGENRYSGWQVRKILVGDHSLEEIQIAIAKGNCFIPFSEGAEEKTLDSTKTSVSTGNFEIVDYSEKAVAIFGDTKKIKDQLKAIGARFNPSLQKGGNKVAGWILPSSKKDLLNGLI